MHTLLNRPGFLTQGSVSGHWVIPTENQINWHVLEHWRPFIIFAQRMTLVRYLGKKKLNLNQPITLENTDLL